MPISHRIALALALFITMSCGSPEQQRFEATRLPRAVASDADRPPLLASLIEDTIPACGGCNVAVEKTLVLVPEMESATAWDLPFVEQDQAGRFYVGTRGGLVDVFSSAGVRLRTLFRRGRGPGEVDRMSAFAVGPGDSLFVASNDRRLLVFSPSGSYARGLALPYGVASLAHIAQVVQPLPTSDVVISSYVATPELLGIPLFLATANGSARQSFGAPNIATPGTYTIRVITFDSLSGALWVADPDTYRLERYEALRDTFAATPTRVLGVRAPFVRGGKPPLMTADEGEVELRNAKKVYLIEDAKTRSARLTRPPATVMRSLRLAGDSLWVAWQVPAPAWRTVQLRYPFPEEMITGAEANDSLWHTVVDVIDLSNERLLLRRRFPFHAHLAAAGVLAHSYYRDDGEVAVDIWSIRL